MMLSELLQPGGGRGAAFIDAGPVAVDQNAFDRLQARRHPHPRATTASREIKNLALSEASGNTWNEPIVTATYNTFNITVFDISRTLYNTLE